MSQSFHQLYTHIIFSTKHRVNWIDDEIQYDVHAYLATLLRDCDCPYAHVGGTVDHIHILAQLGKRTLAIDMIAKVKKESSKFVKKLDSKYDNFFWQDGYGLFSVSPCAKDKVIAYIDNQKIHHQHMSYKDEFIAYLNKYQIAYDERYLWL